MPEEQGSPGADVVDVFIAIDVKDVGALAVINIEGGEAYRAEGTHGAIDPPGIYCEARSKSAAEESTRLMLSIEVSLARPKGELLPAYNMLSYKVRRKCRGEGFLTTPAPRSIPPLRALRQQLAPIQAPRPTDRKSGRWGGAMS